MAVLITGGAGFIGSHAAVEFLEAGEEIVILDNFSNSKPVVLDRIRELTGKDFRFYEVDLLDREGVERVFRENEIDSCIHFAGLKAVGESVSQPLRYYNNNITSTCVLCETMSKFGAKTIVFSSSATVYGTPKRVPIKESDPTGGTTNPYGETKHMIERILTDVTVADPEWKVSLLRYFNPIGAHKSGRIGEDPKGIPNNLLPYITQVAAGKRECLSVFGNDYPTHDGTGVRDYIHVVDLAKAHVKALGRARKTPGVEVFNIGTGVGYSVLDIVHAYEQATGIKINYKIAPRRPGDIAECYADPTRAYDMCRDSNRWQLQNPDGYPDKA